uniref:Uncharacterized protein n=1 Tax=Lutzomyia longipalpis TaxID=7200 RepID=A0A1B0CJI7_LUTLO
MPRETLLGLGQRNGLLGMCILHSEQGQSNTCRRMDTRSVESALQKSTE